MTDRVEVIPYLKQNYFTKIDLERGAIGNIYAKLSGATFAGPIDMDNNDIVNVKKLGIGVVNPADKLDIRETSGKSVGVNPDYGGESYLYSYDRTNSVYIPLNIQASEVEIHTGSSVSAFARFTSAGVGIGLGSTSPGATLDVARGSLIGGTAIFRGTTHGSHFNYGGDEHIFIRGGKDGSTIYLNDTHYGPIVALGERIQFRCDNSATGFWINFDGGNTVISAKAGDIYYGYDGISGLKHRFYAGGTSTEIARIDSEGIKSFGNLSVGTSYSLTNGIACGNILVDYAPTTSNWSTSGTTLLLNALDYVAIGFHDSGNRVDYIRVGAGVMTLGYDAGFGAARVDFGGIIGTAWNGLSFGSGWANYGGAYQTGQYKKVGDIVYLRGLVYRFTGSSTTIATMSSGFRPPAQCLFIMNTNTGAGRLDIQTDGQILTVGGGTGWIQLDGLSFSTS